MNDWTAGYVADVGYTYGYYAELNPIRVKLALLAQGGYVFPEMITACELGFGQGLSINLHAAASNVSWHGTDFNPAQASFAQDLASNSKAQLKLSEQSFAEFCARSDLPDFNYIGLHGIWSWISDENRAVVVDFIRRRLTAGGVLYVSYNTQPGWSSMLPMRDLLTRHTQTMGTAGQGTLSRIDAALDFAEQMLATNPLYSKVNPHIVDRIKKMKEQNRHYLAHEYFNQDWHPMSFNQMEDWLKTAKLSYAGSAHYIDYVDAINLTPAQQQFLKTLPDPMFQAVVRDFMCNTQFRRDYWVKGLRKLNMFERTELLRAQRVVLTNSKALVDLNVTGTLGEATLNSEIYIPILELMADYKPRTIGQIEQVVHGKGITFNQLLQAMMVLIGKGDVALSQDDKIAAKVKPNTDALNQYLINKSRGGNDIAYLACPLTGGGINVNRFQQLFLLARSQGKKLPTEWAQFAWQCIAAQDQRLTKEGKTLETADENLTELTSQAVAFSDKRLPILKALLVI